MKLSSAIKLIFSILLIIAIYFLVDFQQLKVVVSTISLKSALLVILLYGLGQILSSIKWWLLANAADIKRPWLLALRSYFIGMFVNSFGLGVLGGDLARAILITDGKAQKTAALSTVIADRATGLAVLSFIGISAILFFGSATLGSEWLFVLIGLLSLIILGWFAGPNIILKIIKKDSKYRNKAEEIAKCFPKNISLLLLIFILSACFHALQISMHYFMADGLNINIPWKDLLVTIPFVNIMSSLPISWNGLGVREAGYIFFLTPHFLTNEQAVAFGAIWLLAVTVNSGIGGLIGIIGGEFKLISKEKN